jgi:hypothetical protein
MNHYEAEFNKLAVVKEHLMNAATCVRTAGRRLDDHGELHEQIQGTLGALEEAIALANRAKQVMLTEWRSSLVHQTAAGASAAPAGSSTRIPGCSHAERVRPQLLRLEGVVSLHSRAAASPRPRSVAPSRPARAG